MVDQDLTPPMVSIVMPAHDEAESIGGLVAEVEVALARTGCRWEVIIVDDGSSDATAAVAFELASTDQRVRLVRLSRNFGHQAALLAGLRNATGDAVISMDADGQHPAHVLPLLIEQWRSGVDVVNTRRQDAETTSRSKRSTARLFYRLFRWFSGLQLENGMADFRLLSRPALAAALAATGNRPFFRGAAIWIGFDQAVVDYEARDRSIGSSSYSIQAMVKLARDGIIGFSSRPLLIMSSLGLTASLIAFAIASYAIIVGLVSSEAVPGWASTIGFLAILQGLTFALLGVFGAYLGALYDEVLDRPTYILRDDQDPEQGA